MSTRKSSDLTVDDFYGAFKPGSVVRVTENPMFLGYDVTYTHKQYTQSIKISKEMLEDNMATAYASSDQMFQQQLRQQQAGLIAQHTHDGLAGVFGGSAGSGWATTTTDNTANTLGVDNLGGKIKQEPKKRFNWYRVNDKMNSLGSKDEPLDDLRIEMAEWLEGV